MTQKLDVTVITGMSGAGRSAAADVLEDLGFFVIDNLPAELITNVCELASDKKMTRSILDDVAGLGPVRRARLLKEHGSVKRLRELAEDDLVAIPWLPEKVARAVYAQLHGERSRA